MLSRQNILTTNILRKVPNLTQWEKWQILIGNGNSLRISNWHFNMSRVETLWWKGRYTCRYSVESFYDMCCRPITSCLPYTIDKSENTSRWVGELWRFFGNGKPWGPPWGHYGDNHGGHHVGIPPLKMEQNSPPARKSHRQRLPFISPKIYLN